MLVDTSNSFLNSKNEHFQIQKTPSMNLASVDEFFASGSFEDPSKKQEIENFGKNNTEMEGIEGNLGNIGPRLGSSLGKSRLGVVAESPGQVGHFRGNGVKMEPEQNGVLDENFDCFGDDLIGDEELQCFGSMSAPGSRIGSPLREPFWTD